MPLIPDLDIQQLKMVHGERRERTFEFKYENRKQREHKVPHATKPSSKRIIRWYRIPFPYRQKQWFWIEWFDGEDDSKNGEFAAAGLSCRSERLIAFRQIYFH
jgi:hypothetical protein